MKGFMMFGTRTKFGHRTQILFIIKYVNKGLSETKTTSFKSSNPDIFKRN